MMYKVTNRYHDNGVTRHRKIERAINARDMREGDGWEVWDDNGRMWDKDFDNNTRILFEEEKGLTIMLYLINEIRR